MNSVILITLTPAAQVSNQIVYYEQKGMQWYNIQRFYGKNLEDVNHKIYRRQSHKNQRPIIEKKIGDLLWTSVSPKGKGNWWELTFHS